MAFGQLNTVSAKAFSGAAPVEPVADAPAVAEAAEDKLRLAIDKCLAALRKTLEADPAAYGLIPTLLTTGNALVDVLADLSAGVSLLPASMDETVDRRTEFVQAFAERVVGVAAAPADSAARAAAVRCARKLLEDDAFADAVVRGADFRLPNLLFCVIYELFLKSVLTEFIAGVAAAKLSLALPLLYLIDPGGKISDWIADAVVDHLLDPCAEHDENEDDHSLADLGRDLLEENVRRLLGLPIEP